MFHLTYHTQSGYQPVRLISNLQAKPSSPNTLRDFGRPRLAPIRLNVSLQKRSSLMPERLRKVAPSWSSLIIVWALLISLGLGYLLWESPLSDRLSSNGWITGRATDQAIPVWESLRPTAVASNSYTHLADVVPTESPTPSRPPPQTIIEDTHIPLDLWGEEDSYDIDGPEETNHTQDSNLPFPTSASEIERPSSIQYTHPLFQMAAHVRAHGYDYAHQTKRWLFDAYYEVLRLAQLVFHFPNH
jgi:hypothetical protein